MTITFSGKNENETGSLTAINEELFTEMVGKEFLGQLRKRIERGSGYDKGRQELLQALGG
jgi:hypothetical protein